MPASSYLSPSTDAHAADRRKITIRRTTAARLPSIVDAPPPKPKPAPKLPANRKALKAKATATGVGEGRGAAQNPFRDVSEEGEGEEDITQLFLTPGKTGAAAVLP